MFLHFFRFCSKALCSKALMLGLVVLLFRGILQAQSGNVVISTNTTWPAGVYSLTSLMVNSGAVLTIGGGSTVTVNGAVLVTANSSIVLQGVNTTAQVNGVWAGAGSTINAASVEVDAGSTINADSQGYVASAGPGGAQGGTSAGGSYGGQGGTGSGVVGSAIYGSTSMPVDLGSGGGGRCCGAVPGAGGGAVLLVVSGTFTNNGTISANGGNVVGLQAGGGAGGTVYVTTAGLTGSGVFEANGGSGGEAGGGGGRIAVYYSSGGGFTGYSTSAATGGLCGGACASGNSSNGAAGTVGFFGTASGASDLTVYQMFSIPAGTTASYNSITVQQGAILTVGGGSTIGIANSLTVSGTVIAQSINNTALVNGTWQGTGVKFSAAGVIVNVGGSINADSQGYVANAGPAGGPGGASAGGSYGGMGGVGNGSAALGIYGSTTTPADLGSGGSSRCCGAVAGAGGGDLSLTVSGTITNNGTISANGGNVVGLQAGGGAGGTVYVTTAGLSGSGVFQVNGGTGGEAGGGGGRIAVYYNSGSGFTGYNTSTALGGTTSSGGVTNGGAGTVGFYNTAGGGADLSIYQNYSIPANTIATYSSIAVLDGATLTVGGGSTITVTGALTVTGNSNIVLQSINNTAQVNGAWIGSGVTLNAASVQVDAGSTINADNQGYVSGAGPGAGANGTAGASYGGVGGGQAITTVYGSSSAPTDLGSGGGTYQAAGGTGGGAIRLIVSGSLTDNGIISANGGAVGGNGFGGGGAGGSVYVTAGYLAGSGTFLANGGGNPSSYGSSGSGGRIAIYSGNAAAFSGFTGSTASGGAIVTGNGATAGAPGTSGFFDTSAANYNLTTYQNFAVPAASTVTYNSIEVQNAATFSVGGGSTVNVTGALTVTGNSSLIALSANSTAQVNGLWIGAGITLNTGSTEVDAGSSITADAQGYVAQQGPGAGVNGSYGGSYGGVGGGQAVTTTYGSSAAPLDLGSGGGLYQGTPGAGGGAIHLTATGTLTNNGTITANGAPVVSGNAFSGGGAGGSIYVTTATLAGSGVFTANGGGNAAGYGNGGSGGRIAVYYSSATNFTGFTASTATGGAVGAGNGAAPGANGTAAFFDTSVPSNSVSIYQNFNLAASTNVQYNSLNLASGATLAIGGGSQLIVLNTLHITGTISAQSINNTGQVNGVYAGRGIKIVAGTVTIDPTGAIIADSQGYPANTGPGAGVNGSNGGSYGGVGGGNPAATTYGSATTPIDLGSGGGVYQGTPGAGGGAIELLASGTLTNNGVISANGGPVVSGNAFSGGGSGGSVYVAANTLVGTGTIAANGGSNPTTYGNGGGGGRIAVYYITNSGFPTTSITVNGGTGNTTGAVGTITYSNTPVSVWLLPTQPVIHGTAVPLSWFTDNGGATTVKLAGPQTQIIAQGTGPFSTYTLDTTKFPDGAYELRLEVLNSAGAVVQEIPQPEVINNSVVWHSGTLTASQEWSPTQGVHGLDGTVIVPAGVTLTIDPGTIVKALPGAELLVEPGGTLIANGTTNAQIIFTTFDDSSIGGNTDFNQGLSLPSPGEWGGIVVLGGGTYTSNSNTVIFYAQTKLSGTLSGSTTLLPTQVYEISGTLIVPSGDTLNILPGAIVKFDLGAGIDAQPGSTLLANGTLAQPIYFTSINDTSIGGATNPTGTVTSPSAGDWNSVEIDGATASFNFVQMQYGGGPINSNAQAGMIETGNNAVVTLSNSTLAYSYFIALQTGYPNGSNDTVTVTNTTFYANEDRAINTFTSTVHVVNDTFDSNASGVFVHGGTVDIANSVVTNSNSTQFGGIGVCCGGTLTSIVDTDVFTTSAGVSNYIGYTDPTGTNGNISATPVYMNGPQHDYRPTYGSPLIDAANGTVANYPTTDAYGDPRYTDPLVTTKTGTPDASGKYPDIGAFEFVQTAPSNLDLTVPTVQGPSSATVGTQVQVKWTVTNIGMGTAYGPWHDSVYLIMDPMTNPQPVLAGTFLEGAGIVLGPGASYNATANVTVPGTTVGPHDWEVKTNVRGEVFEGANTANNTGVSTDPVAIDLTALVPGGGAQTGTFSGTGASAYYKVIPASGQATSIQLALTGGSGSVQLFVGAGYVPSPQQYDYQQIEFDSTTASLVIPAGTDQTFYVTAYAQSLGGSASFTIQASTVQFSLTSVSPATVFTGGVQTISYTGGGFTANTTFGLVSPTGVTYIPSKVFLADSDHADVSFDLTHATPGNYSATASNGAVATLTGAVNVINPATNQLPPGVNGNLEVWMETPAAFRAGFPAQVTLHYQNIGTSDMVAPLIFVGGGNVTLSEIAPACSGCSPDYQQQYANTFNSGLFLGTGNSGPAGVLPAGASGTIPFLATPYNGSTTASFYTTTSGPEVIATQLSLVYDICASGPDGCILQSYQSGAYGSAASFCSGLTPPGGSVAGTTRACMLLMNNSGYSYSTYNNSTFGNGVQIDGPFSDVGRYIFGHLPYTGLNSVLANDATALSASGSYEYDSQRILTYELQKDGLYQFLARYHQGAFGYGPSDPFDVTAEMSGGIPIIHLPNGFARRFLTPSPTQANVFLGASGDYGTVTVNSDNSLTLTELSGQLYHFAVSGSGYQFDYGQDRNGDRITLTYTGSLISSVADSFGNTLAFQYDSLGHVTQITDNAGRTSSFTYDTLNDAQHSTFLTSIVNATGTTTIKWNEGSANGVDYIDDSCVTTYCGAAIGITNITFADGSQANYTYDAAGRLTSQSGAGGAQTVNITYNSDGSITATDALGKSSQISLNFHGFPTAFTDALGNVTTLHYDGENKLTRQIGPLGDSTSITWDNGHGVIGYQQPSGNYTSVAYTNDQMVSSITDPAGSLYGEGFDAYFNRTSLTNPAGAAITYTYDSNGNVLTRTNRRGQTTTYTYTASGQVATQKLSTGALTTYTYDNDHNLQTITTSAGVTHYTYNTGDKLTGATNPDGTSLTYTYNSLGQRSSLTDSTGFITNYTYDTVGRLSTLTNGSGTTLVTYTYDADGHIATKTFANGTTSTYSYDANSNVLSVIHKNSANSPLSEYDYTYDAEERPLTQKSPAGTTTYTYDLDGQLTSAATPSGTIQYTYDNNGNRTAVTTNGTAATYLPNNLNEYTQANGSVYTYDADGNVLSGNGITYTYDETNHLLTQVSSTDSWSYQYDGLGNRIAFTHNGVTTRLLTDALGQGNVLAELSSTGAVQAHYVYGSSLVGSVQASGAMSFYHFDGTGNTTQVTNASGTIADNYSYLPFGEKTTLTSTVYNPFTYSGSYGVRDEGSGLYSMGHRVYNPTLGRFQQQDPIDFGGGDVNLYRYANNSPVLFTDPQGLSFGEMLSNAYDSSSQALNYAAPFITNETASFAGNAYGLIGTGKSLIQNSANGNGLGTIHDLAVGGTALAANYLKTNPALTEELVATPPGAVLYLLINNAGTIDQASQDAFNGFFDDYYKEPSPLVCGSCVTTKRPPQTNPVNKPIDPNGKLTSGYGNNGYVPVNAAITYTVYFENQPTASAPAISVSVSDQLASNLDWSTLQLNSIAFNNVTLNIPSGLASYSTQTTVSTDPNPVNVSAGLNPSTGLLTFTMQSVDPLTGTFPANPTAGFLPPDNSVGAGEGSVTFTITPKKGLTNASAIINQASIIFDVNAALATNTVTNTIDSSSPISQVNPLPSSTSPGSIPVSWSGTDPSGSGIASYTIYVSVDSGTYMLWLSATAATSGTYPNAASGHTYAFYSLATNNVGSTQTAAGTPALTTVGGTAPTVTVTPAQPTITASQSLSVGVTVTNSSGTPTGSVVLSSGTYTSASTLLTQGAATIIIPAGALAQAIDTLSVTYTPDAASASVYSTASGTAMVTVGSSTVQVMVGTSPSGESFSVDGTAYTSTQSFTWNIGSPHTLVTTSPQAAGGTQATFAYWSDGGAISYSVTASAGTTSYAAAFTLGYLLTSAASPAAGGTVTPATGMYYSAGAVVPLAAVPAAGYTFSGWTGNVASSASATTSVTMNSAQTVTANFTLTPVPLAALSTTSLTFASASGVTTAAQMVKLSNNGSAPLSVSGITLGGTSASAFAETSTCGTTLPYMIAASSSCMISITFTPTATGSFTASLSVADNAANSPQTVALTGTGTAPSTFLLTATPQQQTANYNGSTVTYTINVMPQGGAFTNPVSLSASGLPASNTMTLAPATVIPASAGATSTLTITTAGSHVRNQRHPLWPETGPVFALLGALIVAGRKRRRLLSGCLLVLLSITAVMSLSGCGSQPANYTITITGTSGSLVQQTSVTLILH